MYTRTKVIGIILAVLYSAALAFLLIYANVMFAASDTLAEIADIVPGGCIIELFAFLGSFLTKAAFFALLSLSAIIAFFIIWSIIIARVGAGDAEKYAKRKGWIVAFIITSILFFILSMGFGFLLIAFTVWIGVLSLFLIMYLIIILVPIMLSPLLILDLIKNKKDIAKL
jgi:hypothetical protein